MRQWIDWFYQLLNASIQLYFEQECPVHAIGEIPVPEDGLLEEMCECRLTFEEQVVVMLALMPHLCPQALDIFFVNNKNFGRSYTEFGGWKGISHGGFLPTGETAAFLLAGEKTEKRKEVIRMFDREHPFYLKNILHLEGQGEGEPFLSGQLRISEEILYRFLHGREYKPDYSMGFPAKRITTSMEWEDLVVDYQVALELEEINAWIVHHREIMEEWGLKRILKPGFRALFYGPPGTGKTLSATLLGKHNGLDVYRIDLSMIVSKYIGETEKNLSRIFDQAENRNWILFFDEADALFGKRTAANTSNDRHANQEVAYLLQRIEDFPGIVILATNLQSNIDEAFIRRFQSQIYFPMPDEETRRILWQKMLSGIWEEEEVGKCIEEIVKYEISGGAMTNVIRRCALGHMLRKEEPLRNLLVAAVLKEMYKEGKLV